MLSNKEQETLVSMQFTLAHLFEQVSKECEKLPAQGSSATVTERRIKYSDTLAKVARAYAEVTTARNTL